MLLVATFIACKSMHRRFDASEQLLLNASIFVVFSRKKKLLEIRDYLNVQIKQETSNVKRSVNLHRMILMKMTSCYWIHQQRYLVNSCVWFGVATRSSTLVGDRLTFGSLSSYDVNRIFYDQTNIMFLYTNSKLKIKSTQFQYKSFEF